MQTFYSGERAEKQKKKKGNENLEKSVWYGIYI